MDDLENMAGVLNFDLYESTVVQAENKRQFSISIKGNDRDFWFKVETEKDC